MKKTLKRFLSLALVVCVLMSYAVPAAGATDLSDLGKTKVTYNFSLLTDYNDVPDDPAGKTNPFAYILTGNVGESNVQTSIPDRYASGDLNWTYEAASAGMCGTTTADEHLPKTSGSRMLTKGIRNVLGEDEWLAFRIKSPGAGNWSVKLNFYGTEGAPTVAVYIMEAEGSASIDHDTVLARQETIHAAMDPDNRVGKANLNAGTVDDSNTAFIGYQTFEADKEYIVVVENYDCAEISGNYTYLTNFLMTKDGSAGTELTGEDKVNEILVQKNVVPASDGGYMSALAEVNGHDYYFLPLEGGKMAIFDLDKHVAGEESLVKTVTTGLYYPTHATVTDDGRVIVGGDGKRLFIFDTKTMTGRTTPDFRVAAGLEGEGHNQGSHYGSDGYLYFGTLYGGHAVQYDIEARTYTDLGDLTCASVRAMAGITENAEEESGGVRATYYHDGYLYAKASSDNYTLLVKVDVAQRKPVAAIDVTEQLHGSGVPHGVTVLGDKYVIAGGNGGSGMVLVDLDTFTLVEYDDVVEEGLFSSKSTTAQDAWEHGMNGHASEVINGKQYFLLNNSSLYSYDVATGQMAKENSNFRALRTGQKASVTLDCNGDGVEETYVLSYASSGLRLFNVDTKTTTLVTGLEIDMSAAGGSSINIGTWYDDVLYIGAWNNWNCAAFDTKTETISSRYVTGGQTDSQTHYVDEDGNFHLISGNYSACVVYEIDPVNKTGYGGDADSNIIKPLIANMKQYDQKRIHTVETGDGYVFAGTIPDSYVNGGGVGTYNIATGEEDFIHFKETPTLSEKCVPAEFSELWDLAVKGIVYSDGRLYGATTRSGGSGSSMVDGTSAQVFVMDYENMAIEATLDLRDYLTLVDADGDGVEDPIDYVGGLSVDEQGRIWGIVSDVLFCFTYDKSAKTFTVQEVLNLGHSEYKSSGGVGQHNRKIIFDKEHNNLFVSFFNAKMQQITLANWNASVGNIQVSANETILSSAPETYTLGADNNLYYASGTSLYMKPVNLTDADWTEAKAMDAQIEALGDITTDKADDVAAAKETYNNLSLRNKALVQETRALLEAEAQVLELQIDAAIENLTVDSAEILGGLLLEYDELEESQKRYVQNYTALLEAYEESLVLISEASDVQDKINALPDAVTLDDEETVIAARAAYDALTEAQQKLVDTTKLDAAEAQIDALKVAQTVQAQIDALPDTVTLSNEAAVIAARQAYDDLTDAQKATVDTTKLDAAEAQINALKTAQTVQAQINALPDEITLENEAEVKAARNAYNALTAQAQATVDTTKLVAAEAKLDELAAAAEVQAQIDALPDGVVVEDATAVAVARAAYDALTDELKAAVNTEKLEAAEATLADLAKNAAPSKQVYDFELYRNPVFYTDCTKYTYDETAGRIPSDMPASKPYNSTYSSIAKWFYASYAKNINWGIELTEGSETAYTFRGASDQGMRMTNATSAGKYASLRIFVPAAGLYSVDITSGNIGIKADVYVIPANTAYANARTSASTITAAMTAENMLVGDLSISGEGTVTAAGQWNFEAAGDYIIIFSANATNSKGISLRSITLNPVINETNAVAQVGEELFLSLDQAFAYQIENSAQKVNLFQDATVGDLVLEPGAVLDLNGHTLTVDSVLSYASSEIIDSSEKDTGVLVISDAEGNMLSADNAQLPIYDAAAGGLRFFEISVKSAAITGKGSADPKYWFQVSCVNFDEIHKLIDAGSELNITVKMSWNGGEADAVAGADFLNRWADAFANNENIYITVSAVNTEGMESFSLTPCMAANGVTVKGSEM